MVRNDSLAASSSADKLDENTCDSPHKMMRNPMAFLITKCVMAPKPFRLKAPTKCQWGLLHRMYYPGVSIAYMLYFVKGYSLSSSSSLVFSSTLSISPCT